MINPPLYNTDSRTNADPFYGPYINDEITLYTGDIWTQPTSDKARLNNYSKTYQVGNKQFKNEDITIVHTNANTYTNNINNIAYIKSVNNVSIISTYEIKKPARFGQTNTNGDSISKKITYNIKQRTSKPTIQSEEKYYLEKSTTTFYPKITLTDQTNSDGSNRTVVFKDKTNVLTNHLKIDGGSKAWGESLDVTFNSNLFTKPIVKKYTYNTNNIAGTSNTNNESDEISIELNIYQKISEINKDLNNLVGDNGINGVIIKYKDNNKTLKDNISDGRKKIPWYEDYKTNLNTINTAENTKNTETRNFGVFEKNFNTEKAKIKDKWSGGTGKDKYDEATTYNGVRKKLTNLNSDINTINSDIINANKNLALDYTQGITLTIAKKFKTEEITRKKVQRVGIKVSLYIYKKRHHQTNKNRNNNRNEKYRSLYRNKNNL